MEADILERLCVAKGLRMTEQRRIVARVLASSTDHPDVDQLFQRCTRMDSGISISTIYRILKRFEEAGIVARHDFHEGRARYEPQREDHHDHLIDMRSGKVLEFHSGEIEILVQEIARRLGYTLVGHRLELHGLPFRKRPGGRSGG